MTLKELTETIAKLEGKKSQVSIGDIREIVGILSDLVYEQWESASTEDLWEKFYANGKRRAKRKSKK